VTVVVDSWVILRYLEDEGRAAAEVDALLGRERPVISWINLGEVHSVVRRRHGAAAADEVVRDLRPLLTCDLPDEGLVLAAAAIKADHAMAYADAFAAATAIRHQAVLWTGDPELLIDPSPWAWADLR